MPNQNNSNDPLGINEKWANYQKEWSNSNLVVTDASYNIIDESFVNKQKKESPDFLRTDKDKALFWSNCGFNVVPGQILSKFWKRHGLGNNSKKDIRPQEVAKLIALSKKLTIINNFVPFIDGGKVKSEKGRRNLTWEELSRTMAERASGKVYILKGTDENPEHDTSVFNTIEYPALLNNPNVTELIQLDIKNPNGFPKERIDLRNLTRTVYFTSDGKTNKITTSFDKFDALEKSRKAYLKRKNEL